MDTFITWLNFKNPTVKYIVKYFMKVLYIGTLYVGLI